MENEIENLDSPNEEAPEGETPEEKSVRLEEANKHLYARAKKAEGFELVEEKWVKKPKIEPKPEKPEPKAVEQSLSTKDVLFLAKADIHEDDLGEVLDWAKFKNISVNEAHKQLKGTLSVRAEERRTAEVTQTGKTQRGTSKVTGESLLERAESTGEVPEDEEGLKKLFQARQARKIK